MEKKDSDSGQSHHADGEEEKRIDTQRKHENELQAFNDPDANLSAEERAQIVSFHELCACETSLMLDVGQETRSQTRPQTHSMAKFSLPRLILRYRNT